MWPPSYTQSQVIWSFYHQQAINENLFCFQNQISKQKDLGLQMATINDKSHRNLQEKQLMVKIMCLVNQNTLKILQIDQKILESQRNVKRVEHEMENIKEEDIFRKKSLTIKCPEGTDDKSHKKIQTTDPLMEILFGKQTYRYKLQLENELPDILYKEKNFDVKVKLIDLQSNKVMNSNVIYLCIAVAQADGTWITENKVGEPILKGQTEVELYHGQASFRKMYSREVSRKYIDGILHFVAYAKPSVVLFSSTSSFETIVNYVEVQPLLIKNVRVMSKKF